MVKPEVINTDKIIDITRISEKIICENIHNFIKKKIVIHKEKIFNEFTRLMNDGKEMLETVKITYKKLAKFLGESFLGESKKHNKVLSVEIMKSIGIDSTCLECINKNLSNKCENITKILPDINKNIGVLVEALVNDIMSSLKNWHLNIIF